MQGFSPRWLNLAIGVALCASAFSWTHGFAAFRNTLVVGCACSLVALLSLRSPELRYLNRGIALWLFASVWILPVNRPLTFWCNLVAAALMFVIAQLPSPSERTVR